MKERGVVLIFGYSIAAAVLWLIFADRTRSRELYSTVIAAGTFRFLEQYVQVYVSELWQYKKLPLPLAKMIGTPILLDVIFYPAVGWLFIQFLPASRWRMCAYFLLCSFVIMGMEASLEVSGYLRHDKVWSYYYSYVLVLFTFMLIYLQYLLYLKTGWFNRAPQPGERQKN